MPGRTLQELQEHVDQLEEKIRREKDTKLRAIQEEALQRYYGLIIKAEEAKVVPRDRTIDIILVFAGFVIIALTVILSFAFLSLLAAVGVIIGMFALLCLMMGVMLRVWGDISSNDLLTLVREGFKALFLLRRGSGRGGAGGTGNEGGGSDDDPQS